MPTKDSAFPYAHLPYRPCVGVMLLNAEGKVLVGQRIDTRTEAWQMPQGGIDDGEAPQQAALRELREEIGTDKATLLAASTDWLRYDLPVALVPEIWGGKYRGQEQKWFCMRFTGVDGDINLATHTPEFHDWQWIEPPRLPSLIVPFKRDLYTRVLEEFRPYWHMP